MLETLPGELIAAEVKNWWRIFIALLIKRKRGNLGKFVPPPKIMHMKTHRYIQLFYLLYFTNIIQRHTNWFSKYSDQKKINTRNHCEHFLYFNGAYIFINNSLWLIVSLNWDTQHINSHYSPPLRLCLKFPIPCQLHPSNYWTWPPSSPDFRSPEAESGFVFYTSIWQVVKAEVWRVAGLAQEFRSTLGQNIAHICSETDLARFIHLKETRHGVLPKSFLDFWFPYLHLGMGMRT